MANKKDDLVEHENPTGAVPQTEKKFRTPYGVREREVLDFPQDDPKSVSLTQQNMMADCDIHNILKRHEETGMPLPGPDGSELYGDFSNAVDYQSALDTVMRAQEQFEALPARIRDRFANDPQAYLGFLNDPKNLEEAVTLGLVSKKEIVEPKASQAPQKEGVAKEPTGD